MQILNVQQQSSEWFEARQLKMTASHATAVGSCGKGLETYAYEICAEYLSSADKEHFSNEHTDRGNEKEPEARTIYEFETGQAVKEVGFCIHSKHVGCSPDGFVGDDGLVEIKCPSDKVYLKELIEGKISSAYIWQMQMQMLITGRKWCDYVCYNPNFAKNIIIIRVHADRAAHVKLQAGFAMGAELINKILKKAA